jgi:hypothetical protein
MQQLFIDLIKLRIKIMLKKNIIYFLIILFTLVAHNTFLNSYIILNNNYESRMNKYGGFCEPEGYGFLEFVYKKYKLNFNLEVKNFKNMPSITGYFYNVNRAMNENYIVLIGISELEFNNSYNNKKYRIIEKKDNCYFVKKNV